ncbi:putative helix-turn-helix containsing protein [Hydrogenimonas sp.]|nr:putative helix-turn-helix containsing protein [Hydrogenimonas sp.]
MHQLESFYESTPKAVGFIERKIEIPSHTVNLYGAPRTGKTWSVLDYMAKIPKRKRLYIDLRDLRIDKRSIGRQIGEFIRANGIETVAIDHFDGSFALPVCRQTIVVTEAPYRENPMMPLLQLHSLDFEEYLAFEKRHLHLEHSFSSYLRTGSLPAMATTADSILTIRLHENIRSIFGNENEIHLFKQISLFQGKPLTIHQLYTALKREHRISKDWLYKKVKSYEERRIVSWLPKYAQPKAAKRVLFYDFAMPASMHFEKSLMGQLYTIAAAKLKRREDEIFYTDKTDFFDPVSRRAILISPFANQQSAAARISRIIDEIDRLEIPEITLLTIANSFEFTFEKTEIRALPFYEWVLRD